MITYSKLTYGDITREVLIRLNEWRTGINYSDYEIKHQINHAIREVMSKSLPYKDWAYKVTVAVTDGTAMPKDFIKQIRVILQNGTRNVEARYVTPQEFYKTSTPRYGFNTGYLMQPIYTIWGVVDALGTLPEAQMLMKIRPITLSGFMDCYIVQPFLYDDNVVVNVPFIYEQLVVLSALVKILGRSGDAEKISTLQRLYYEEKNKILKLVEEKNTNEKKELDSFVDAVPPRIPPQPEQGEMQKKL